MFFFTHPLLEIPNLSLYPSCLAQKQPQISLLNTALQDLTAGQLGLEQRSKFFFACPES